jgi:hypothetical protein
MRVVGVFDAECPVFAKRVLDLCADLLVSEFGQVGELALSEAVALVGHHDAVSP